MTQAQLLKFHEPIRTDLPRRIEEKPNSNIITMGEVIGMINMVLSSIIKAIEKSGVVGENYLETNLKTMRSAAGFQKKAKQDSAKGAFSAAVTGITISGLGMAASLGAAAKVGQNVNQMQKIQSTPLTEPAKIAGANSGKGLGSIQGQAVEMTEIRKGQQILGNKPGMEASLVPSEQQKVAGGDKVLHGQGKNATSYASDAEKDRAIKIQERLNDKVDRYASVAGLINPQTLPVGNVEQARKEDDSAKAQHVSDLERAISETIKTLQNENGSFHGALGSLIEKLAIANIVTQTLIASSQWR